jgi:hypothetical protein
LPYFEESQLDEFEEKWADFDLENWGAASRPRPTVPDHEIVLLVRTEGKPVSLQARRQFTGNGS